VHNSARSQFAEEYALRFAKTLRKDIRAESAGLEPGELNPYVVKALKEDGIDIAGKKTRSVIDLFNANREYEYVVTVCSREAEERCPVFPGISKRLNWPFEDPADFTGTPEEIAEKTRILRDRIKGKVEAFVRSIEG